MIDQQKKSLIFLNYGIKRGSMIVDVVAGSLIKVRIAFLI